MNYIIVNKNDEGLCWSNGDGWTDTTFDTFSEEEREQLSLPIGGEWHEVIMQR